MTVKVSQWRLLPGIVDRPGSTLASVAAFPRWCWVVPALFAVGALALSTAATAPLMAEQTQQLMSEQMANLSPEQAALVQGQMAVFQTPLVVGLTGFVAGLIGLVLGWLVQATVLYFSGLVAGGEAEFGRVFATAPWLYLPFALEMLLQSAYVFSHGGLIVNQGLSYLVSSGDAMGDARNLAYVALSQVTLFRLWSLVLVYMLFRAVMKLGRTASLVLTLVYLALTVGGQLALAALSGMLTVSL